MVQFKKNYKNKLNTMSSYNTIDTVDTISDDYEILNSSHSTFITDSYGSYESPDMDDMDNNESPESSNFTDSSLSEETDKYFEKFKTDEFLIDRIMKNPQNIRYIKNPTLQMCMIAVKKDPTVIDLIKDERIKHIVKKNIIEKKDVDIYKEYMNNKIILDGVVMDNGVILKDDCNETNDKAIDNTSDKLKNDIIDDITKVETNNEAISAKKEEKKWVYYQDVNNGKNKLIKNSENIIDEMLKYTREKYGETAHDRAKSYYDHQTSLEEIRLDDTFSEGVVFIKKNDKFEKFEKFEMYKKTTKDVNTGIIWKTKKKMSSLKLIRIYSYISME